MESYRDWKKDIHLKFIDLEKAHVGVPHNVLWRFLKRREVLAVCIRLTKDMYEGVKTSLTTLGGYKKVFLIDIGLHQGLALNPFLFIIIMDKLTKEIQDEIP